jgi:hypothetical protein
MSNRSQASLKRQYESAVVDGDVVVFVRDNARRKRVNHGRGLSCTP